MMDKKKAVVESEFFCSSFSIQSGEWGVGGEDREWGIGNREQGTGRATFDVGSRKGNDGEL
jgi:hypothetical protein